MSNITNTSPVVTEEKLTEFYEDIKPFLGCPAYVTQEGDAEYYSTDEKVVGRWIDGKPIYQTTITNFGAMPNKEIKEVAHNIANIDKILYVFGVAITSDNIQSLPLSTPFDDSAGGVMLTVTKTTVKILCRLYDYSSIYPSVYVTIKYTKTTDSASTTIEQKPTHYSTDEQVVGTWIDGKPIYQKTIDCGALPNNTTKSIAHGISNIDAIIKVHGSAYNDNHNGFSFPLADNNSAYSVFVDKDGDYIRIGTAADRSSLNHSYVTLQYTKTTD